MVNDHVVRPRVTIVRRRQWLYSDVGLRRVAERHQHDLWGHVHLKILNWFAGTINAGACCLKFMLTVAQASFLPLRSTQVHSVLGTAQLRLAVSVLFDEFLMCGLRVM